MKKTIFEAIGNTPIMTIPFAKHTTYAKLEYLNPGGSIKDRSALYMIKKAEERGLLKKNGILIEASSGNQGASAAMIGNSKGYKTIITMSNKVSLEKQNIFKAYGVEIILCEPNSDFNNEKHYYQVAKKLAQKTPNAFFLNQYFSSDNSDAHFYNTAPEIDRQIGDKISYFFIAMGSAGTAHGIARYFKIHRPSIKIIGVDSKNGYLATKRNPQPYYLDGMGIDYDTPFYDLNLFHDIVLIEDIECHSALQMLAKKHGILVGPSSGGVVAGILKYADKLTPEDAVGCLFADSGRSYLSKDYYTKELNQ